MCLRLPHSFRHHRWKCELLSCFWSCWPSCACVHSWTHLLERHLVACPDVAYLSSSRPRHLRPIAAWVAFFFVASFLANLFADTDTPNYDHRFDACSSFGSSNLSAKYLLRKLKIFGIQDCSQSVIHLFAAFFGNTLKTLAASHGHWSSNFVDTRNASWCTCHPDRYLVYWEPDYCNRFREVFDSGQRCCLANGTCLSSFSYW